MRSLKLRLSLGLLISMLIIFGILSFVVSLSIRNSMEQYVLTRLQHDAENLLGGMQVAADSKLLIDTTRIQGIYQQPFSGHYFVISTAADAINSRSLWDQLLTPPSVNAGETVMTRMDGPQDQKLLVLVKGYQKGGQNLQIAVAEDMSHLEDEIHLFRSRFAIVALLALLGLIIFQRFSLQRGLRPIGKARQAIQQLERGEIEQLDEAVPTEIHPLVHEINRLIDSQRKRLRRSRDALGNLTHAIKTPLSLIQHLLGDTSITIDSATREQLQGNTERIATLLDHELKRARLAGHAPGTARFNISDNVAELVKTLQQLYPDKLINFSIKGDGRVSLLLDQEDGMELFGNLLDNAWKWAASQVSLTISKNDGLLFRLEDDGPGCAQDKLTELTRRGLRFDESTQGHGIGLSIVQAIVENLGGTLRFSASEKLGGLCVEIELPLTH